MARDSIQARPVVRDDGALAIFYPLHNLICPPATEVEGEIVVARMMRGKDIRVRWEHFRRVTPTLIFCRECKLGVAGAKQHALFVECIHGTWTNTAPPKTATAQRLGADIASCSLCGRTHRTNPNIWTYTGENPSFLQTLIYCGSRCRERAMRMPLLA